MNASPSAKYAPVGALRIGLVLMVLGALAGLGPVDAIPTGVALAVFVLGGIFVAVALGIRMLRP